MKCHRARGLEFSQELNTLEDSVWWVRVVQNRMYICEIKGKHLLVISSFRFTCWAGWLFLLTLWCLGSLNLVTIFFYLSKSLVFILSASSQICKSPWWLQPYVSQCPRISHQMHLTHLKLSLHANCTFPKDFSTKRFIFAFRSQLSWLVISQISSSRLT